MGIILLGFENVMATKEPACVGKGGVVQFNCLCSATL